MAPPRYTFAYLPPFPPMLGWLAGTRLVLDGELTPVSSNGETMSWSWPLSGRVLYLRYLPIKALVLEAKELLPDAACHHVQDPLKRRVEVQGFQSTGRSLC